MEVYLDNAATTRIFPSVRDTVLDVMERDYGNPSSVHKKGWEAENHVRQAREEIASVLKCTENEVVFTSCGTEANNLALTGAAMANHRDGKHIISTRIEHPSVQEPLQYLKSNGFEVTYLPVDGNGKVDASELVNTIRGDTILVSLMAVNNEI